MVIGETGWVGKGEGAHNLFRIGIKGFGWKTDGPPVVVVVGGVVVLLSSSLLSLMLLLLLLLMPLVLLFVVAGEAGTSDISWAR